MEALAGAGAVESASSAGARETRAALALAEAPGFGPAILRVLIDRLGSATAVLAARPSELADAPGMTEERALCLSALRPVPEEHLHRLARRGIRVVSYGAPGYPERLAHLHHPPPVLYLLGPLDAPVRRAVAVVGTRRATEYGRRTARGLAADLAAAGWTVVSGLARGIDAAAHRGALEARGATVGVLGSGLDHAFPASSRPLYAALRRRGLLISEFAPGVAPARGLFPRRNRIIAALADAVVVVQAGSRSGALITVAHALDLGREVLAVPGQVGHPGSEGVHALLRDGAHLATCAADVLTALGEEPPTRLDEGGPAAGHADPDEAALLIAMARGIEAADDLAAAARLDIGRALAALSRLEIRGAVRALPGGRFASEATPLPSGPGPASARN
ncbi:MAG: DNA-processing protein DprA [Gemmatimonadota bacterium]